MTEKLAELFDEQTPRDAQEAPVRGKTPRSSALEMRRAGSLRLGRSLVRRSCERPRRSLRIRRGIVPSAPRMARRDRAQGRMSFRRPVIAELSVGSSIAVSDLQALILTAKIGLPIRNDGRSRWARTNDCAMSATGRWEPGRIEQYRGLREPARAGLYVGKRGLHGAFPGFETAQGRSEARQSGTEIIGRFPEGLCVADRHCRDQGC